MAKPTNVIAVAASAPTPAGDQQDPLAGLHHRVAARRRAVGVGGGVGARGTAPVAGQRLDHRRVRAALGRAGRVHVKRDGDATWIGGDVTPLIHGQVRL